MEPAKTGLQINFVHHDRHRLSMTNNVNIINIEIISS